MKAWNVYLDGKNIDTVFYNDDIDAEEVKRGLVDHDGYDPNITVEVETGTKKPSRYQADKLSDYLLEVRGELMRRYDQETEHMPSLLVGKLDELISTIHRFESDLKNVSPDA